MERSDFYLSLDKKKNDFISLGTDKVIVERGNNLLGYYSTSLNNLQLEIEKNFLGKKAQTETLAAIYSNLNLDSRSQRVLDCGTFLEFKVSQDKAKLQHANFCKDRLCPMCNWRRSLKIFAQVSKVMNCMNDYDFLFLTLTVKNCVAADLPKTVQALYDGWRYLYNKNKEFKTVISGTFRSLEVTRNKKDGTFHPHLHCILAVKPSYFKKGYISQKRWSELWAHACDLDYNPIVHIQKVKDSGKGISGAVAEVSKYSVKGSDFLYPEDIDNSCKFVQAFLNSLSGRRLCGWTGIFSRIRKQLQLDDIENGDLVHTDDTIRTWSISFLNIFTYYYNSETVKVKKKCKIKGAGIAGTLKNVSLIKTRFPRISNNHTS